jgi:hypothetical protein
VSGTEESVDEPDEPPEDEVPVDESGVPDAPPEEESSPPQPAIHVVRDPMDRAMTASERNVLMVRD